MSNAPICHIPPVTTTTQPGPKPMPSIPIAQPNLASLTATVNAMRQVIMIFTGQMGAQGQQGAPGQNAPSGSWTQQSIQTEKVKIFQNNDPTTGNFVEVERINQLVFGNNASKQTWTFNRPSDSGS
jgi:hypothetical protein